jgi:hypothetical protein
VDLVGDPIPAGISRRSVQGFVLNYIHIPLYDVTQFNVTDFQKGFYVMPEFGEDLLFFFAHGEWRLVKRNPDDLLWSEHTCRSSARLSYAIFVHLLILLAIYCILYLTPLFWSGL